MYPAANTNIQILIYFSCFIIYCFLENFNYFKGWNFFEVDFWSRDFWGVSIGSPRDFFGFWFLPSLFWSSLSLEICSILGMSYDFLVFSKFLWAACLFRPFWFVHVKWPHINWERLTAPFKGKVTICCESWFWTRFAKLDSCTNGESSQGPSPSGQKTKDAPTTDFLIILQRRTAVTQHGMVIHVFAQATVCLKLETYLWCLRSTLQQLTCYWNVKTSCSHHRCQGELFMFLKHKAWLYAKCILCPYPLTFGFYTVSVGAWLQYCTFGTSVYKSVAL